MKLTILANPNEEFKLLVAHALVKGCVRHGDCAEIVDIKRGIDFSKTIHAESWSAICCWGWRLGETFRNRGHNVLIMERAYLADRFSWYSLGWNGLNGRAIFPCVDDGGERWRRHFDYLLQPWRTNLGGYALLLGQVPVDQAVNMINFEGWACAAASELIRLGHDARFRPHPLAPSVKTQVPSIAGTLEEALTGASFAVTWNSNAGVDAVIAGTPTVTMDEGAMAWDVTSHDLDLPIITPNRTAWAHRMAYTQWRTEEIERGEAWEHLRKLV